MPLPCSMLVSNAARCYFCRPQTISLQLPCASTCLTNLLRQQLLLQRARSSSLLPRMITCLCWNSPAYFESSALPSQHPDQAHTTSPCAPPWLRPLPQLSGQPPPRPPASAPQSALQAPLPQPQRRPRPQWSSPTACTEDSPVRFERHIQRECSPPAA